MPTKLTASFPRSSVRYEVFLPFVYQSFCISFWCYQKKKKTLFQNNKTLPPTPLFAEIKKKNKDVAPKYAYRMYIIHVSSKELVGMLIHDGVPEHGLFANHVFGVDSVALKNVCLFDSFFAGLGAKAEMGNNTSAIGNSICWSRC